jgi:hypothetical protein
VNERETRNNDFQDFSASFSPVSDAKQSMEAIANGPSRCRMGSSRSAVAKQSAFHLSTLSWKLSKLTETRQLTGFPLLLAPLKWKPPISLKTKVNFLST